MNARTISVDKVLMLVMLALLLPALVAVAASLPDIKRYLKMLEM